MFSLRAVRVRHVAWLLVGLTAGLSAQAGAPTSADTIARDLQKKYDRVTDFSAAFVHSYRGGVLRQQATERGQLLVKKPGRMRWEYTAPEKKTFVSDGHKLYSYIPRDKQVIVSTVPAQDAAGSPAMFLTGKGNIVRDYTVAFDKVDDAPAGAIALRLTPRTKTAEFDWLTLVVAPGSLDLLMLVTTDAQGGRSAFTFSNLKENVGLSDKEFVFQMPKNNVEVLTDAGTR